MKQLEDIARRNAGPATLTVFDDGSFVVHGRLDAEIDQRCDWGGAARPLISIDLGTLEPFVAPDLQSSISLHEKILRGNGA